MYLFLCCTAERRWPQTAGPDDDDGEEEVSNDGQQLDKQSKKKFDKLKEEMLRSRRAVRVMTGQEAEQVIYGDDRSVVRIMKCLSSMKYLAMVYM